LDSAKLAALVLGITGISAPALADPCHAPLPEKGATFKGEVTYIVDGDGMCVGKDQGGIEVRLADFNACEMSDPGGKAAKENLRKIVFGKQVECVAGKRSYDRVVARCTVDGQSIGELLRRAGTCEGGNGAPPPATTPQPMPPGMTPPGMTPPGSGTPKGPPAPTPAPVSPKPLPPAGTPVPMPPPPTGGKPPGRIR